MSAKALNSQPGVALGGSGTLSHVYIQHPPLRCTIPGSKGLFYDDGNKLLLSVTSDQVFAWKTVPLTPPDAPSCDSIGEGPVLSVRYSLDAKVLGIQRSNHEIQFKNRETGEALIHRCRLESEIILGFFWIDCPTCDVVIVKTSGLDLFTYEPEVKILRLVETKKLNVCWYVYTHESRMVLLASGMQCKTFTGFQFSSGGIIRLPRFDMAMAQAEVNKKPVLAAEDVHIVTIYGRIYCLQVDRVAMLLHLYRFYRDAVIQQGSLTIYSSKIAVSVVDNVLLVHQVDAKVVILYDMFADSRAPISAPLPLLVRGLPRANASSSRSSINDALHIETNEMSDHEGSVYGEGWIFLVPDLICDFVNGFLWRIHLDLEAIAASNSEVPSILDFLQRRKLETNKAKQLCLAITRAVILERRPVLMVARAMDVLVNCFSHSMKMGGARRTVSGESTSTPTTQHGNNSRTVVDDPMSRVQTHGRSTKHEPATVSGVVSESIHYRTKDVDNESLGLTTFSTIDRSSTLLVSHSEENVNLALQNTSSGEPLQKPLSSEFHDLGTKEGIKSIDAGTSDVEAEQSSSESQLSPSSSRFDSNVSVESQVPSAAISPDEMYCSVFALIEEEMAGDPAYLVAIIVEYLRSAAVEKLKVHPNLYVLTVQLLARSDRYAELGLFVMNKILEPSKEVALQLLESGRQNLPTRKLGMDMLRRLSLHHDYVLLLVQDGYYLEALRYVRKNKVNTIRPSLFLDATISSNDLQHLAAVLRFFSDFIPGFTNTSDHETYYRILNEMNSSVAA
ncbi:PREDICTED: uncharacterized protein C18orf8 isoform X2 [Nelumbo nucifera]|uniref:Mic1 domain-containing protein n=2 Tax=Nelumbo nucifera TaxID=4432 RepID=A0A822ZAL8_NELNU|nr:PREDICTED: uncharacterized protein C18orf8 isoform X2 [Nelumbo nucifera]DAD42152.1 TPA_asm: hypothetical protein HUJ06_000382 [Nelumbo nucifera]